MSSENNKTGKTWEVDAAAQAIDRTVCAEATCPECGHQGMGYRGEIAPLYGGGQTYRAYCICPECGYEEEF